MEKRLLLAVLLSMAVLLAMPYLFEGFLPQPPQEQGSQQTVETATPAAEEVPVETEQLPPATPEEAEGGDGTVQTIQGEPQILQVSNSDLRLEFSSTGAVIRSARLTHYLDSNEEPLQLLPQVTPYAEDFERLLALILRDRELQARANTANYAVEGSVGAPMTAPTELTFRYRDQELDITKRIRVPAEGYALDVRFDVLVRGGQSDIGVVMGTGIGDLEDSSQTDFLYPATTYYSEGSVTRYYEDDLEGDVQLNLSPQWAGIDSQYFAYLLLSADPPIDNLRLEREVWAVGENGPEEQRGQDRSLLKLIAGLEGSSEFEVFLGPKKSEILQAVEPTLEYLIDYGWFEILVRPLLAALKFLNQYIRNYGWSIIALTFLINLVLFPIRYKQMSSMQRMSEIQPKLRSIQDKYKRMKRDDPRKQQMNAEVMAMYKEHGVNPLGGCLPLLVQMPILFAFYQMLVASIELRGAPFIFWIQDLSRPDPFYVTPIVMGASMLIQQNITPSSVDPAQKKMMMFLPVVFTFFFLNVSSGLALYFLFSNVFAMMFQLLLQKVKPELMKGKRSTKRSKKK